MAQLKDLIVNGPSRFIGSVQASADPVQNMELATKQYVDNATEDLYDSTFVSASWTNGTTSGPTLEITVNDAKETATIPEAGTSQSGVITTGQQYISGTKIFYNSPQVPTVDASSNDTTAASTAFVYNAFKANDAMVFKGLADPDDANYSEDEWSILARANTYSCGDTYMASSNGLYAGQTCEQNDLIIAIHDHDAENGIKTINNNDWIVVQTNIVGAITGTGNTSANNIPIFNANNSKVIKDSGITVTSTSYTNPTVTTKSIKAYVNAGQKSGTTLGIFATAEGENTTASGRSSHAEGSSTNATGNYSHVEGYNTIASALYSHAEGNNTTASGQSTHTEGYYTTAKNSSAHAEGAMTMASGYYSHAEGQFTIANGIGSHAEGRGNFNSNNFINVTGSANSLTYTVANGIPSNLQIGAVICANTTGNGLVVIVVNKDTSNNTITVDKTLSSSSLSNAKYYYTLSNYANGEGAHVEGCNTKASAAGAHAEGQYTAVEAISAHAEGYGTIANKKSQHVFGEYNEAEENPSPSSRGTYVEIVGKGTADNNRSNARTLDWEGNEELAGNLLPMINNSKDIGSTSLKWLNIYATNFNGNATTSSGANLTTAVNSIAYYSDTAGTFAFKASENGALYSDSANGTLQWGTLPVAQGGTGETNLKNAANALINALDTDSLTLTSNDYVITQYVGGGTTTTTYHRRPASAVRVGGLLTGRKLKVALGSTTDVTFNGTEDVTNIPISGNLDVSNGGTGATSFTANSVIISGSTTTSALTTRAITNNTSNTAISNNTNIPTMNTIYYGLVKINGNNQTRATTIYVPTGAGSNGQFLKSSGSGAPSWSALPVADGSTTGIVSAAAQIFNGQKTFTNGILLGHGYSLRQRKNSSDTDGQVLIYQNDTNLWIGATASNNNRHVGSLYLSAGLTTSNYMNRQIYVNIGLSDTDTTGTNCVIAYANGSVGDSTTPVYIDSNGQIKACTITFYDGSTS